MLCIYFLIMVDSHFLVGGLGVEDLGNCFHEVPVGLEGFRFVGLC